MELKQLISDHNIFTNLEASNRHEALSQMIDYLLSQALIPQDMKPEVLKALEEREEKMSTAIGGGLALPHASISGLPTVVVLIAKAPNPIDFDPDPDNKEKVSLFLMVLVPNDEYSTHLRTLAKVSSFLHQPNMKEKLKAASTSEEILTLIRSQ